MSEWCLNVVDRLHPQNQCAHCGGPGTHPSADRGQHSAGALVMSDDSELYSSKHKTTGQGVQFTCALSGRPLRVSDPG